MMAASSFRDSVGWPARVGDGDSEEEEEPEAVSSSRRVGDAVSNSAASSMASGCLATMSSSTMSASSASMPFPIGTNFCPSLTLRSEKTEMNRKREGGVAWTHKTNEHQAKEREVQSVNPSPPPDNPK